MKQRATVISAVALTLMAVCALASCSAPTPPAAQTTSAPEVVPTAPDTIAPTDLTAAADVADAAMAAFVDHERPYEAWWARFSPYLGDTATVAFEYTDPANVPASNVTGTGLVSALPSATQVTVLVPTDVGQYAVTLNRQGVGGAWTVTTLTSPEGVS